MTLLYYKHAENCVCRDELILPKKALELFYMEDITFPEVRPGKFLWQVLNTLTWIIDRSVQCDPT